MDLQVDFRADLYLYEPCAGLLQIEPAQIEGRQQVTESRLILSPFVEAVPFQDMYGNPSRQMLLPRGYLTVEHTATVSLMASENVDMSEQIAGPTYQSPLGLHYLLPSRYCPSDRLVGFALDLFGAESATLEQVEHVRMWVNEKITYAYNTSGSETTAMDTLIDRRGVCRDFAHLCIALCRALTIPARYVSGYCLGLEPQDVHAYFEVLAGSKWIRFDATQAGRRPALVQIAVGRDAADCAWSTFFGRGDTNSLTVGVRENQIADQ